jgi:predicted RNA-binding Zn-ribbon protein involved in translation (DUF1610 family)
MLNFLRRMLSRFFRNSRQINNEPLNKVSLIVIILIDLFILSNTFQGLNEISQWPISPTQAYPCQVEWQNYRQEDKKTRDIAILRNTLAQSLDQSFYGPSGTIPIDNVPGTVTSFKQQYQQNEQGHRGKVSDTCLSYGALQDQVTNQENKALKKQIDQKQKSIQTLQDSSTQIRAQYDSSLLDEISGQSPDQSINTVAASEAKQKLSDNNNKAYTLKQEVKALEQQILKNPDSLQFLKFLQDEPQWKAFDRAYQKAEFWHPTRQLIFQALFLLPLLGLTLWIYRFCQRRGYGLAALICWHLLVVFFIPFVFKLFEILQFGPIFVAISNFILKIAQGMIFLVRYVAILTIPLLGFGLIRFFQRFVFNAKLQAANRVQQSRCIRCAKRLAPHDHHCPHCGYHQLADCPTCHNPTYKHLPHCKNCGASQAS